jgi:hypothetical protein
MPIRWRRRDSRWPNLRPHPPPSRATVEWEVGVGVAVAVAVGSARPLHHLPKPLSILLLMLRRICTLELQSSAASRLGKVHWSSCRRGPVVHGSRSRSPLRVLLDVCVGSPRICSRQRCQEIKVLHAKIPRPTRTPAAEPQTPSSFQAASLE